jgi:2-C-methyl-D-erythritol 4-phosphate cytidylyltransferase
MTLKRKRKNVAILVGAGKGKRMGGKDKTFLNLSGQSVLAHSVSTFEDSNLCDEIILVVRKNKIKNCREIVKEYQFKKVNEIIAGGATRQASVYKGLNKIKNANLVLVHDIPRPLISDDIIKRCVASAEKFGAAIPVILVRDTVKAGKRVIKKTVDRSDLRLAQTPQVFKYEILKKAHESAKREKFAGTDDASLAERLDYKVRMVAGSTENLKLTIPEDLIVAKSFTEEKEKILEIKAYAKINLSFKILGKLPGGYHKISSVFQAVNLYDSLLISKSKKFELSGSIVCSKDLNLIKKAKSILERYTKRKLPCKVHLIKAIPVSAGLGGGSSDAASFMVGLNKIYDLQIPANKLAKIALEVGCDVPFFVLNFGRALVEGKGEKIKALKVDVSKVYVLARPHKRVNTAQMYQDYDQTGKSFFKLAKKICPAINEACNYFSKVAYKCGMSGSGPTVFAEFGSFRQASKVIEKFGIEKFDGDLFICEPLEKTYKINKL